MKKLGVWAKINFPYVFIIYWFLDGEFCVSIITLGKVDPSNGSTVKPSRIEAAALLIFPVIPPGYEDWKKRGGQIPSFDISRVNPLTDVAISKLLETIGISAYFPRRLDRYRSLLGHKPDYRHGWLSEYVRKSMHACHSASAACRPAETAGRRGEIGSVWRSIRVGQIRPISVKGLSQNC